MTFTCVSETSGKASIGRLWKAIQPPPINRMAMSPMNRGWCKAKLTIRLIMQRLLKQKTPFGYHTLPWLHPCQNHNAAILFHSDLNLPSRKLPSFLLDEDIMFLALQKYRF